MDPVAKILFEYLRDVIYRPTDAALDMESLPPGFSELAEGLQYLAACVLELRQFAHALSRGDLDGKQPAPGNELAAPLKSLRASLQHLTWQAQQIAKGDYQQRIDFMGNFSIAFNVMIQQLQERRKQDDSQKSQLQQYVDLLLDNCLDIILLFDTGKQIIFTSESYLRHSGEKNADGIRGKSFSELFAHVADGDFLRIMDNMFHIAITSKITSTVEQELLFGESGEARHYRIQVIPMLDDYKMVVGTMLFLSDLTESIHARQAAEHARRMAEQSARAKSEFLARMSHEMRTPMNAIIGMAAIAKSSGEHERMTYCLDKINDASQHLLGVINDILDMSKIEADKLELSFTTFNLAQMLRRTVDILSLRIEERKLDMSVDIDEKIPVNIISDEQRLAQVVINILSNAVKFTPERGSVSLTVKNIAESDGICTLRFVIKDTGIGISEEQQKRLFVLFGQADGGLSRKYGGTGLGLVISRRIVNMLGGDMWVESELGKGASFLFDVKAVINGTSPMEAGSPDQPDNSAAETLQRRHTAHERGRDEAPHSGVFAGKRILLAEDIDINREIVSAILEDSAAEIVFAVDGAEAVAKFSADPEAYDAILMDIHMPVMDGYEATRKIRASGLQKAATMPIIAMTANVFREDVERCIASGMNSHLGKPIDIDALFTELKKYLA